MDGKHFAYSIDEDECFLGDFPTVESALAGARNALKSQNCTGRNKVYIGQFDPYEPVIDADRALENLADTAYEDCGEPAEDYLDDVTASQAKELEEMLTLAFLIWAKKHNMMPDFSICVDGNIEVHVIDMGTDGGACDED